MPICRCQYKYWHALTLWEVCFIVKTWLWKKKRLSSTKENQFSLFFSEGRFYTLERLSGRNDNSEDPVLWLLLFYLWNKWARGSISFCLSSFDFPAFAIEMAISAAKGNLNSYQKRIYGVCIIEMFSRFLIGEILMFLSYHLEIWNIGALAWQPYAHSKNFITLYNTIQYNIFYCPLMTGIPKTFCTSLDILTVWLTRLEFFVGHFMFLSVIFTKGFSDSWLHAWITYKEWHQKFR